MNNPRRQRTAASLLISRLCAGLVLIVATIFDAQNPWSFIALCVAGLASVADLYLFEWYDRDGRRDSLVVDLLFGFLASIAFAIDGGKLWWVPLVGFLILFALSFFLSGYHLPDWIRASPMLGTHAIGIVAAGLSVMRDYAIVPWVIIVVAAVCILKFVMTSVRYFRW